MSQMGPTDFWAQIEEGGRNYGIPKKNSQVVDHLIRR